ncbi:MAG TPA: RNase J family beta-CASP ribonuclease [Candidatus Thermoplasmatota archaeon]|jgi:ribonuclease J|nr:RNase J family beta-CASP ribonuclease [Candidatus Thermoplasmatota archaeon]
MDIEVIPLGGYNEVGRNMTCVRVGRDAVIFDMGIRLDRIMIHEDKVFEEMSPDELQQLGAIPNDEPIRALGLRVKAIVVCHGHLDHMGALLKLAAPYKAPIIATPFTIRLLQDQMQSGRGGRGGRIPNQLIAMKAGQSRDLGDGLKIEFLNITHSIVQSVIGALHTPKGVVVYGNDFKFDNTPVVGQKPDYERLRSLGMEGVNALVVECLGAGEETKTPSEAIARDMLRDYLFGLENERHGILVSTFSSHTARIKSICEFGVEMDRRVVLLGRSMEKYTHAAIEVGELKLPKEVEIVGGGRDSEAALKRIVREGKDRFLVVATGHQGEPDALLSRIANKETSYPIEKDDHVIFSAGVIPNPLNVANRYVLESKLRMQGARIIKGAHVSGHASREDHRELLRMLEPANIYPSHGPIGMQGNYVDLAEAHGWKLNQQIHVSQNGQTHAVSK